MTVSPLGRYADGSGGAPLHRVHLLRTPVRLMVDGRERHDALLRELAVLALADGPPTASALSDLAEQLGVEFGAVAERPDEVVDRAAHEGRHTVDLVFDVPASVVAEADRLEELMARADALCQSEQLLTLPRTPLQQRFAAWYVDELRRQVRGEEPQPWDGPLDP